METIWKAVNGHKTTIAALAGLILSWAQAKGYVSGETAVYLASALTILTGVAIGHKSAKAMG